ncbi:hypothetical protein TrVE_jg2574 [Triparma verrucosa]|uniref:WKF domain-containing protein n=1 Tax=Triparma verrucosa TaxID=1606542 RepID=A0A9W7FIL1_9STRA|nr:hypothetical protein TrVE_jg2574 [Triparma verrucosa]
MPKRNAPNPVHKKKNVAKHILKASAMKRSTEGSAGDDAMVAKGSNDPDGEASTPPPQKKKKRREPNKHTKDPSEASNYLVTWALHKKGEPSPWKFNKNTQSWLLRHMYNDSLVNKSTFKALLEYSVGLGEKAKEQKLEEAGKLIEAYKEWEKTEGAEGDGEGGEGGGEEKGEEKEEVKYDGHNFDACGGKMKRKVYKRARLMFDVLKK